MCEFNFCCVLFSLSSSVYLRPCKQTFEAMSTSSFATLQIPDRWPVCREPNVLRTLSRIGDTMADYLAGGEGGIGKSGGRVEEGGGGGGGEGRAVGAGGRVQWTAKLTVRLYTLAGRVDLIERLARRLGDENTRNLAAMALSLGNTLDPLAGRLVKEM